MKLLYVVSLVFISGAINAHDFQKIDEIDRMDDTRELALVAEADGIALYLKAQRELGFMQKICGMSTEGADRLTWFENNLEARYRIDDQKPKKLTLIPKSLTWAQAYSCSLWKAIKKNPDAKILLIEITSVGGDKPLLEFNIEGLAEDLDAMYKECKADKRCK